MGPPPAISELQVEIRKTRKRLEGLEAESLSLEADMSEYSERIRELKEQLEAIRKRELNRPPPLQMRLPYPDPDRVGEREPRFLTVKNGVVYETGYVALIERCFPEIADVISRGTQRGWARGTRTGRRLLRSGTDGTFRTAFSA